MDKDKDKDRRDSAAVTSNPFARLLVFYSSVRRSKLNDSDLTKIVKKYKSKPDAMMVDLQKKYNDLYHFPKEVLVADIIRILNNEEHSIPLCFREHLDEFDCLETGMKYDPQLDIRADQFNAVMALDPRNSKCLLPCAPVPGVHRVPRRDNISKVKSLLPGSDSNFISAELLQRKPNATDSQSKAKKTKNTDIDLKPLDRIALASSKEKVINNEYEEDGSAGGRYLLQDSPLILLHTAMQQRRRVRVMIRRINCIRGSLDGFVRGFDKHFNLLLTDVDETYTITTENVFEVSTSPKEELFVRHLPQLLVRGDNIVLVCFRDN